jgi:hypothetical protein
MAGAVLIARLSARQHSTGMLEIARQRLGDGAHLRVAGLGGPLPFPRRGVRRCQWLSRSAGRITVEAGAGDDGGRGMKRLLLLGVSLIAGLVFMAPGAASAAGASTLAGCLARQHVCVSTAGRSLISQAQEAQLARQIGGDGIYLVVAASGSAGYNSAMNQIIRDLNGHPQFTVGFLDSRLRHFGAYNKGMLPAHGAADIATQVVRQHQSDPYAALTAFVGDVKTGAVPTGSGSSSGAGALIGVLIAAGVIVLLGLLGFFFVARPIRRRRQQELRDAKLAAQDDLIALSSGITDHGTDLTIQRNQEAADEQAAALTAYERGTAALDAARHPRDMGRVSRLIAEGQYHLACAAALAAGRPRPDRRPSCFFDPRHGMSVRDVYWTPADGGPGREVPACSACAHQVDEGIEPELRTVAAAGGRVRYIDAGFAPAYWGGYGFLPGMFTGFFLGEMLTPHMGWGGDFGGGDFGGGDFGGGDFGGGGFGGGGFGGGDFGGGDFGGGGNFS